MQIAKKKRIPLILKYYSKGISSLITCNIKNKIHVFEYQIINRI